MKKYLVFGLSGLLIITSLLYYNQYKNQKELEGRVVGVFASAIQREVHLLEGLLENPNIETMSELRENILAQIYLLALRIHPHNKPIDYFYGVSEFYQTIIEKGSIEGEDYVKINNIYDRLSTTIFNGGLIGNETVVS